MEMLQVSGLTKKYGTLDVLKGIDFTLDKGQVLSIIGSSGSGKTTLLRCLNFLEKPDGGTITLNENVLFDAADSKAASSDEIRQKRLHFGLVFQSFNLFPQYTVLENVTLAMDLQERDRAKQQKRKPSKETMQKNREKAKQLLREVGLEQKAGSYPFQLSGGQQQRVAIARALALEPDILCFDEPTSALDPELTGEVLRVMKELRQRHTTMIVVTHEMDFAYNVSDKVIFMANGKIEEEGTPQQVFDTPKSELTKAFVNKSKNL